MYKYIIYIFIGIIVFYLLNNINRFSVGSNYVLYDEDGSNMNVLTEPIDDLDEVLLAYIVTIDSGEIVYIGSVTDEGELTEFNLEKEYLCPGQHWSDTGMIPCEPCNICTEYQDKKKECTKTSDTVCEDKESKNVGNIKMLADYTVFENKEDDPGSGYRYSKVARPNPNTPGDCISTTNCTNVLVRKYYDKEDFNFVKIDTEYEKENYRAYSGPICTQTCSTYNKPILADEDGDVVKTYENAGFEKISELIPPKDIKYLNNVYDSEKYISANNIGTGSPEDSGGSYGYHHLSNNLYFQELLWKNQIQKGNYKHIKKINYNDFNIDGIFYFNSKIYFITYEPINYRKYNSMQSSLEARNSMNNFEFIGEGGANNPFPTFHVDYNNVIDIDFIDKTIPTLKNIGLSPSISLCTDRIEKYRENISPDVRIPSIHLSSNDFLNDPNNTKYYNLWALLDKDEKPDKNIHRTVGLIDIINEKKETNRDDIIKIASNDGTETLINQLREGTYLNLNKVTDLLDDSNLYTYDMNIHDGIKLDSRYTPHVGFKPDDTYRVSMEARYMEKSVDFNLLEVLKLDNDIAIVKPEYFKNNTFSIDPNNDKKIKDFINDFIYTEYYRIQFAFGKIDIDLTIPRFQELMDFIPYDDFNDIDKIIEHMESGI